MNRFFFPTRPRASRALGFLALAAMGVLAGCGGGSSSSTTSTTVSTTTLSSTVNAQKVVVDGLPFVNSVYTGLPNALYTTVNICLPGSTTACQAVFNVQVDTGSSGLRLLSSAVYIPLTANKDSGGNTISNCGRFSDGSVQWGVMSTANVQVAGEIASSVPIQLIGAANSPAQPAGCASGVITDRPPLAAGANGILGIGMRKQDCGAPCASAALPSPVTYFTCGSVGCAPTPVALANQLQNPVALFPQDNNGVVLQLPAIGDQGSNSMTGTLLFGIATQSNNNNFLGAAQIQTPDANGHFITTFNGVAYANSYFASGARAIYFPSASLPVCLASAAITGLYCPTATQNFSALVTDVNKVSSNVAFSVANPVALLQFAFGLNRAFNNLGGPAPSATGFIWGMPFFYGRSVYVAIEGQTVTTSTISAVTTTSTTGPFIAF